MSPNRLAHSPPDSADVAACGSIVSRTCVRPSTVLAIVTASSSSTLCVATSR